MLENNNMSMTFKLLMIFIFLCSFFFPTMLATNESTNLALLLIPFILTYVSDALYSLLIKFEDILDENKSTESNFIKSMNIVMMLTCITIYYLKLFNYKDFDTYWFDYSSSVFLCYYLIYCGLTIIYISLLKKFGKD